MNGELWRDVAELESRKLQGNRHKWSSEWRRKSWRHPRQSSFGPEIGAYNMIRVYSLYLCLAQQMAPILFTSLGCISTWAYTWYHTSYFYIFVIGTNVINKHDNDSCYLFSRGIYCTDTLHHNHFSAELKKHGLHTITAAASKSIYTKKNYWSWFTSVSYPGEYA